MQTIQRKMKEIIKINGKQVGWIYLNMYFSHRKKSIHLMKKYNAYGISEKILDSLESKGVRHIVFIEDNKKNYVFNLMDYLLSNEEHLNNDNDLQVFVDLCKAK